MTTTRRPDESLAEVMHACDPALVALLRPILARIVTEAELAERTVTTITPYTHATETFLNALGEVSSLARLLYAESATPEERTQWFNHHVRQVAIMNEAVEAFQNRPEVRSVFGRGVRTARMETFFLASDLLTRALRGKDKLKERICQAQREMARLARLTFADEYHPPTIAAIQDELVGVLKTWKATGKPYGFRWYAAGALDHAERGDREDYRPGPTEIALRLIGEVAGPGWKTVEATVRAVRTRARRR